MPPKQASRSSILTAARALCTAVPGCTRKAAQVSYQLPSGKRARICAMHLQRVRRTGELGEADSGYLGKQQGKRRDDALAKHLAELRSQAGVQWVVTTDGHLTCSVRGVTRRQAPAKSHRNSLRAMERRGWLKIGDWQADGSRVAEVTKKGLEVLEG